MTPRVDPEQAVKEILIAQGTAGIQQGALSTKCNRYMSAEELSIFLHELRDDRKVDKYEVTLRNRKTIWWRATTEILNDW